MARLFHPDMHPEDTEAYTSRFQEITEAYETLSDNEKKETYDQQYRYYALNEKPAFETYYYEPPFEYEPYQPPVASKRKTYASYAAFLFMAFYFIKMISGSISTASDVKYDYQPLPPATQQPTFLNTPKDTLVNKTPVNEVKKPW